jgi:hypothetical protein
MFLEDCNESSLTLNWSVRDAKECDLLGLWRLLRRHTNRLQRDRDGCGQCLQAGQCQISGDSMQSPDQGAIDSGGRRSQKSRME